jgi:hypothetical protein
MQMINEQGCQIGYVETPDSVFDLSKKAQGVKRATKARAWRRWFSDPPCDQSNKKMETYVEELKG